MSVNTYDIGSLVTISTVFTNVSGVPTAPTLAELRVMDPSGTETDYTVGSGLNNPSTGAYNTTIAVLLSGVWSYRWEATGVLIAASDNIFIVSPTVFSSPG